MPFNGGRLPMATWNGSSVATVTMHPMSCLGTESAAALLARSSPSRRRSDWNWLSCATRGSGEQGEQHDDDRGRCAHGEFATGGSSVALATSPASVLSASACFRGAPGLRAWRCGGCRAEPDWEASHRAVSPPAPASSRSASRCGLPLPLRSVRRLQRGTPSRVRCPAGRTAHSRCCNWLWRSVPAGPLRVVRALGRLGDANHSHGFSRDRIQAHRCAWC